MQHLHLNEFFTYETNLPGGVGFGMFHIGHFVWLGIILVGIVGIMKWYHVSLEKRKRRMEVIVSGSLVLWIVLRAVYIGILHENFLYELPLHLCSMAGILCAIHCVTHWEWLGQVLYTLCLPGAVLAMLFPDWSFYPAIHFITVEAFLFHMGIVVYVSFLLYSREIVPSIRKVWQVILFLVIVVTPIYFFDRVYHVNYMFVNWPSPGSPLEWIAGFMGNPGYLVGYAILAITCIIFMYLLYDLSVRMSNKNFPHGLRRDLADRP